MRDDEDSSGHRSDASRRRSRKDGERKRSHKRKRGHKEERRRDRRKKPKDRKERDQDIRRKRRKHRHPKRGGDESFSDGEMKMADSNREDNIPQTLCSLLEERPAFSVELPVILIRLAGGATFDLRQMTDAAAASRLEQVFESLHTFGVQRQTTSKHWTFRNPSKEPGPRELILLRLVRSVLDDFGLTMQEVKEFETRRAEFESKSLIEETDHRTSDALQLINAAATNLLHEFQNFDPSLSQQLIFLCNSILEGESICIDGLPNELLKDSIESMFRLCGLEKSEMEDSNSGDDSSRGIVTMGYSLPEENDERVRIKLDALMNECRRKTKTAHRRLLGPQRAQRSGPYRNTSSDDDEGPLPVGSARLLLFNRTTPLLNSNIEEEGNGKKQREEWMIVPGKNDFLSSIKAGQSINSRLFKNQKPPSEAAEEDIRPEIRQEIDNIKAAHSEARGPSLMSQHRTWKEDKDEKASEGREEWKWKRDDDLDSGRKVDKNALKMILGGAASDLHSKFRIGGR